MAKGGGTQTQNVNQTTSLPSYAQPYYRDVMSRMSTLTRNDYVPYGQERIAGFTGQQRQVQGDIAGLQTPGQFGQASQLAGAAGLGSLSAGQYDPSQFNVQQVGQPNLQQYSMQGPGDVQGNNVQSQDMQGAQTDYNPSQNLNYFQMQGPGSFGSTQAQQYMSPYMQSVVDTQKNEAVRDAQKGQLAQNLGAVRQGTYGGARQLLAQTENQRNLNTQLGNIQAQGSQAAFQNAQQQFNTEQGLQQQANQQNLGANLQTQQLGTQYGTQTALANLSNEQQARVNNQAQQFQAQGMNAQQAMQAALANQQTGFNVGQQNLNSALQTQQLGGNLGIQALLANQQQNLEGQRLGEQSRQFGANLGLQGLAQANQSAQTLGNLGQMQGQMDMSRLGMQQGTAAQQQALNQQYLDTHYRDFREERDYPLEMLRQYSGMLNNVPVSPNTSTTTTAPAPSLGAQIMGTGLGALGAYKTLSGG